MSYWDTMAYFDEAQMQTKDEGVQKIAKGLKELTHELDSDLRILKQHLTSLKTAIEAMKGESK